MRLKAHPLPSVLLEDGQGIVGCPSPFFGDQHEFLTMGRDDQESLRVHRVSLSASEGEL